MLRLAFDFIITWRETRTRPNAYEITVGALFTDNQQSGNPDKDYLLTQHAATFGKSIAGQ